MAAGMYLEHYLDSIENLPFELQRNFNLMRDLDQRTEGRQTYQASGHGPCSVRG
uniref:Inhibitor of growth protein N-terminal histone-binding domain-containing protein n=1 Tax=Salarias fasciatus TaxID=181472 RepID=A0A672FZR9_SALFA